MSQKNDGVTLGIDVKVDKTTEVVEEKYWDAIEVKEIATKLIKANAFLFPSNTPICYVFVNKAKKYWGKCQHMSALVKFMTGYEFCLIINHEAWENITETQREALVFHELEHVGYDADKDKYGVVDHDLEEFNRVVKRYGMWRDSVSTFTTVAMEKIQDKGE